MLHKSTVSLLGIEYETKTSVVIPIIRIHSSAPW